MPTYTFKIRVPVPIPEDVLKVEITKFMQQLLEKYGAIEIDVDVRQKGASVQSSGEEEGSKEITF
jgi:hypothetical protein